MSPLALEFANSGWLLATPLALLPLLKRDADTVNYSWLALIPEDPLSSAIGWLLRILGATVIMATVMGLAGPQRPQVPADRVGIGAEIVVLLDRSRSMDEPLKTKVRPQLLPQTLFGASAPAPTNLESKGQHARRLLAEFAANRHEDMVGLVLFSAVPIPVISFTRKPEMIQAAIKATGVGLGLADTELGKGLVAAANQFDQRPYAGSRLILMVSDGAAELDDMMKERITALLKRHRVGLYWIYIRSSGANPLFDEPAATEAMAGVPSGAEMEKVKTSPERALHKFFQGIGVPYHAYEAEDPEALKRAINDVGRLENLPIHYQELLPRVDFSGQCYALAVAGCLLLLGANVLRVRSWP